MSDRDANNVIDHLTAKERFGTQARLAEVLGVRQSTVAGWKKANAIPGQPHLRRILDAAPELGITVTPDDFFPEREADPDQGAAA